MRTNKKFTERLYSNSMLMFAMSLVINVGILALIVWVSRYSKIKGDIFAVVIAGIVLFALLMNVIFLMGYSKRLKLFRQIFFYLAALSLLFGLVGGFYIVRAERSIGKLISEGEETVDYSVIGFGSDNNEDAMSGKNLGYIKHEEEMDTKFKESMLEYSRTINYIEYEDYSDLLTASVAGDIQYALVPKNYSRLAEGLDESVDPFADVHVIYSFSTVVSDDFSDVDVIKDPFTVLLLGNNEGLSDSIIFATVNPQTLRVTMTSLARDSYLPIACYPNGSRDKLNHSRARGRQCLVDTVENFLDVEVDFYFETDFYALEKIIDALGGLELDSPIAFGGSFPIEGKINEYDEIWVPQGLNLLNGRQAVTFARERYRMPAGDFDRQLNQQYVIREIASKLIRERNPEKLVSVLEGASNNLTMNISIDSLTALLGYAINQSSSAGLDPMQTFRIVQTQITGSTPMINGAWVVLPYEADVNNAKKVIKNNLSTEVVRNNEKSFNFTIKKPFLLSKRPYNDGTTIDPGPSKPEVEDEQFKVPSFTSSWTRKEIEAWGIENKVEIDFRVIASDSPDFNPSYSDGQIIHQTVEAGVYKKKPKSISISIAKVKEVEEVVPPVEEIKPDPEPEPNPPGNGESSKPDPVPTEFPTKEWGMERIKEWAIKYSYDVDVRAVNEDDGKKATITYVVPDKEKKIIVVTVEYGL